MFYTSERHPSDEFVHFIVLKRRYEILWKVDGLDRRSLDRWLELTLFDMNDSSLI
jgi:hypothetical protein